MRDNHVKKPTIRKRGPKKELERGLQTSLLLTRLTCLDRANRMLGAVKREIGHRLALQGFSFLVTRLGGALRKNLGCRYRRHPKIYLARLS